MVLVLLCAIYWALLFSYLLNTSLVALTIDNNNQTINQFNVDQVESSYTQYFKENGVYPLSQNTLTDIQYLVTNSPSKYAQLKYLVPASKGGIAPDGEMDKIMTYSTPVPSAVTASLNNYSYMWQKSTVAAGTYFRASDMTNFLAGTNNKLNTSNYGSTLNFKPKYSLNKSTFYYKDLKSNIALQAEMKSAYMTSLTNLAYAFKPYYAKNAAVPTAATAINLYQNVSVLGTSATVGTNASNCKGLFAYPSGQTLNNVILTCAGLWIGSQPIKYMSTSTTAFQLSVVTPFYDANKNLVTVTFSKSYP